MSNNAVILETMLSDFLKWDKVEIIHIYSTIKALLVKLNNTVKLNPLLLSCVQVCKGNISKPRKQTWCSGGVWGLAVDLICFSHIVHRRSPYRGRPPYHSTERGLWADQVWVSPGRGCCGPASHWHQPADTHRTQEEGPGHSRYVLISLLKQRD